MIDFYGSIGKFIGLTSATNLRDESKGVEKIERAMQVDGVGTMLGASLGTTSIITYVESAVGIAAGGRTGIVAVVCGLLMLASLLLTPLVGLVPVVATAGVLVYVGFLLLPRDDWRVGKFTKFDLGVGIVMALISFFTFSLDKAMVLGFGAYSIRQVFSKTERTDPFLIGAFLTLLGSVILQYAINR
jgi:AGZA family xanthine/uracil permease-like MFS transporter